MTKKFYEIGSVVKSQFKTNALHGQMGMSQQAFGFQNDALSDVGLGWT